MTCLGFYLLHADIVDCGNPPMISNGSFLYVNTTFASMASLQCKEGYSITGSVSYICEQSGIWGGAERCGKFYIFL